MQRIYTTSFLFKLSFFVLLLISFFLLLTKNTAAISNDTSLSDLSFSGNVGIGTTEASPSADLTPPVVNIDSPQEGSILSGIIQILASAWDNVAVNRVEFYSDQGFLGVGYSSPYSTFWNTTQGVSDGAHILSAKAIDTSGNEASSSAVWVTLDNTPPDVNLISPADGSLVSGNVTLQASAWDGVGMNRVDFYADQILIGSSSVYPYTVSWDASALPAGSTHAIYAKAYDLAGHQATSNIANVTIADTILPTVNVTNPLDGGIVSGVVNVSADAADNVAVSRVEFYVDGALQITSTSSPYLFSWDTGNYVNNSAHSIYAKAYDAAGNTGSSSLVNVIVQDISAPVVSITSPVDGSTVAKNSTVMILANASDVSGISKVEFLVNGVLKCTDTASAYSCSWKVPTRKNVVYILEARAYDIVNNTSTSIVTVTSK